MKRLASITALILGAGAVLVAAIFLIIQMETRRNIFGDVAAVPQAQAVLVPGAAVLANGALAPVLKERADAAIKLYAAGKAEKILVSGDNSTVTHNEVNPVRNYLVEQGVPAENIFLDHAGFDTYSSMYRAKAIFLVSSTVIATQSFHLPRALFLADHLGLEAYGFSADRGSYMMKNYIREWFASTKAFFELVFRRKPKYLGEIIPITGDGRNNL